MSSTEKEQLERLRKEAADHDAAAVKAYSSLRTSRWEIAEHLAAIKDNGLHAYIDKGYPDFDAYRVKRGIGRTTCFQSIRFWKELSPYIPRETLVNITKENADQLVRLPIESRKSEEIQKQALTMTEEQLAAVVDKIVAKAGGTADVPESRVPFKVMMYLSQKDFVVGVLKDHLRAEKEDETDMARGLELMSAKLATVDLKDSDKLLTNLVIDLRRIHDYVDKSEESADIQLEKVKDMFHDALMLATGQKDFVRGQGKSKQASLVQ